MGDPDRIRSIVEIAERVHAAGGGVLAMRLVVLPRTDVLGRRRRGAAPARSRRGSRVCRNDTDPWLLGSMALTSPVESGFDVMERLSRCTLDAADAEAMWMLGTAASAIGDYDHAGQFLAVAVAGLRTEGRLGLLSRALVMQAWAEVQLGNWDVALPAADEGARLARETGQATYLGRALLTDAIVAGLRGDEAAPRSGLTRPSASPVRFEPPRCCSMRSRCAA